MWVTAKESEVKLTWNAFFSLWTGDVNEDSLLSDVLEQAKVSIVGNENQV